MKKYILLLLTILSFTAYSQTSPTLPNGAKPYGNQLYILPSTGDIWGGNAGYKYRVVAKKSYVDSLTVLGYKKTQVDSLLSLKADNSRQIITSWGLSGGGDLSANRTLKVDTSINGVRTNLNSFSKSETNSLITKKTARLLISGNSTIASHLGSNTVASYTILPSDILDGNTYTDIAVSGHTIDQQKAAWLALSDKNTYDFIYVEIGLNDIPTTAGVSVQLTKIQQYVDAINLYKKTDAKVVLGTMTPAKNRWIAIYGAITGAIVQSNWSLINDGIMGIGANAIINVDGRINTHTEALSDNGALASVYDIGDGLHENNLGRQIIGSSIRKQAQRFGLLKNSDNINYNNYSINGNSLTTTRWGGALADYNTFVPSGNTAYFNVFDGSTGKWSTQTIANTKLALGLDLKVDKVTGLGLSQESYTTVEKSKLSGIQSGATQNQTDAYLLSRLNHNGNINIPASGAFLINDVIGQTGIQIIPTNDNASEKITLFANNTIAFVANYLGNVGIKNSNPTEALDVTGKARVSVAPTNATDVVRKTELDLKANIASPTFTTQITTPLLKLSALNTAPSSATDTGTLGEIRITATYIYVCTATNTWVRSALATW